MTNAAKTYTVTHADGTVSTRTSKTMAYTHAAVVAYDTRASAASLRQTAEHARKQAATATIPGNVTYYNRQAANCDQKAAALESGAAVGYYVHRWSKTAAGAAAGVREAVKYGHTAVVVAIDPA